MKIEGKIAVVTGGGQGLGEKFCIALLDKGANVRLKLIECFVCDTPR